VTATPGWKFDPVSVIEVLPAPWVIEVTELELRVAAELDPNNPGTTKAPRMK
jgi:hypothetical protein